MADAEGQNAALHLLGWLSPAFPVGAFAYSHAIETAVDAGHIVDAETLQRWLSDLIDHGSARNDVVLASVAWSAANKADRALLAEANDLALAMSPGRERLLETSAMGNAFQSTIRSAWGSAVCSLLPRGNLAYPVAFGASCAAQGLALRPSLEAYGFAFAQNLVSAAVRLGPVGQTDAQRILAASVLSIKVLADFATQASLEDLGGCTLRSDLGSLQHETLYSRLFRS